MHDRGGRASWARNPAVIWPSLAVAFSLTLAACEQAEPEPENEVTGAVMPDTSQAVPTPPDAAATGVVPLEGEPPVQPTSPAADPGAAYAPDVPVEVPDVERNP